MLKENLYLYKQKAKIFKALAHPTRIFILEELSRNKRCVCELTSLIGDDITTVSKHLSLMKENGIVESYKEKNKVFYFIKIPCALNFLACVNEIQIKSKEFAI